MGFSFGILVLSLVGRWLLRASSRGVNLSRRKGSPAIAIGLALTVIGAIGVLLSRLIKAAVSRQREVLADASAVQFTREPMALAGALKKIGGFTPYLETVEAEEVSHMLFGRAGRSFAGWFATHPPLPDRIKALDPAFAPGDYIEPTTRFGGSDEEDAPQQMVSQLSGSAMIGLDAAGTLKPEAGAALHRALPFELIDAAHSSQNAWLLMLALGLERGGGSVAERRVLENQLGNERTAICLELRRSIDTLDPGLLLPLFELSVPALKSRPSDQLDFLFELLQRLSEVDGTVTMFEYLLQRMLRVHFRPANRMRSTATERFDSTCTLLATLAVSGQSDATAARQAFEAGRTTLDSTAEIDAGGYLDRASVDADHTELDRALGILASAPVMERRKILTALAVTMRHDGDTTVREAELFRTVAAVLDCPVPPSHVMS